jgi:hypothetical protein
MLYLEVPEICILYFFSTLHCEYMNWSPKMFHCLIKYHKTEPVTSRVLVTTPYHFLNQMSEKHRVRPPVSVMLLF